MRKLLALLLCIFFLPAHAESHPLADMATISQYDKRFLGAEYDYRSSQFRYRGCGPASIANGFIAAWGITDEDAAAAITLDLLRMVTDANPDIILNAARLRQLVRAPKQDYPALASQMERWGGQIWYNSDAASGESITDTLSKPITRSTLVIQPNEEINGWRVMLAAAHQLYHSGHEDASVSLLMVAAGNKNTHGAFRTGVNGHYISLHVPVKEFCETGAVYLLDSFPRAIASELNGRVKQYDHSYDFAVPGLESYMLQPFVQQCSVRRVSPTVLRITPHTPLGVNALAIAAPDAAARAYENYLRTINLYSPGILLIHVPVAPAGHDN